MRSPGAAHCLTGPIIEGSLLHCIGTQRLIVLRKAVLKVHVFVIRNHTSPLIDQWEKFTPSSSQQTFVQIHSRQANRLKGSTSVTQSNVSVCITLTQPHCGNQGKCNPLSIKCTRRGHGDTALNSHLQVYRRVIQMNLQKGTGEVGRETLRSDRVCLCVRGLKRLTFLFLPWITQGVAFWACTKTYTSPSLISLCLYTCSYIQSDQTKATFSTAVSQNGFDSSEQRKLN